MAVSRPMVIRVIIILCIALSCPISTAWANAQDSKAYEEKRYCLKCHGKTGTVKKFPDGGFISTYVDVKAFDKSVHKSLKCTVCHKDFSAQRHPKRNFRSKLQYQIKESHGCLDCHDRETISIRPIHESLFKKEASGEAVICVNCHSAHAVIHTTAGSVSTSEEKYCLSCHASNNQMVFKNGQSISVHVNAAEIRDSPHKNVGCSDCHLGYSVEDHPRKRFRSEREYRQSSSGICRRCHFDKYSKVSESIHHAIINVGRLDAPTCIDCHGTHAVSSPGKNRLSVVSKCKTCHVNVYKTYAESVHGKALMAENNKDVPICIDCHSSHNIKLPSSPEFHNYIPDMCGKCHSNEAIMGKYGLSTNVVKSYLSDFHGITLGLYRLETEKSKQTRLAVAVCTDCHGIHDITRISGHDTQAVKTKLLKRCQTCHSSATGNFPEAWLSHYKPSLKVAPLVFFVEQFYKIMMPLMVAGLLFQVILHVWRYLVNR